MNKHLLCFALISALALTGCSSAATEDVSADTMTEGPGGSANAALVKLVPEEVRASGKLMVGTSATNPPEGFKLASGEFTGYEIEIIEEIAVQLGLDVEWNMTEFNSIIPGLQANRFDLATAQIGVTEERLQILDFVTLIQTNQAFAALQSSNLVDITIEDLCGKEVAIVQGSRSQVFGEEQSNKCVEAGKPAIDLKVFQASNDAWLALQSQRAEIYWNGATAVGYLVAQTPDKAEIVGQNLSPTPTGIAMLKDSTLAPAILGAMQELHDNGSYDKILDKWGVSANALDGAELNPKADS